MPDRRQFLTVAGLTGAAVVCAACGSTDRPVSAAGATLTCPDPTPGAVTNQSGTVGGVAPAYTDAFATKSGAAFQWEYDTTLTNKGPAGQACLRNRANQYVKDELQLFLSLIGSRDPQDFAVCPYPATPVEVPVHPYGTGTPNLTQDGNVYSLLANWVQRNSRCSPSPDKFASSGTVTFTTLTDQLLEGHAELGWAGDHLAFDFTAPYCVLCAARPSKATCV